MCECLRMHTVVRRRSTVTHRAGGKEPSETGQQCIGGLTKHKEKGQIWHYSHSPINLTM